MKKILLIVVSLLLLIAIPATLYLVNQRQELRKKAAPATMISLSPSSLTKKIHDEFTIEVKIDTADNQVLTTELHVIFDATKLQALSIVNGPLFPNVLASGVVESGGASITVGASSPTTPVKGVGTVATIRFLAVEKTDAPVSIKFAANTFVGGLGEGSKNILIGSSPTSVTITDDEEAQSSSSFSGAQNEPVSSPLETPQEASTSALVILPSEESVSQTTPVIQGKAPPGSTITVTIYSEPVTCIAVADANGNWSCSPDTPLEPGPHNVVVSAAGNDGSNETASTTIVVATGSGSASAAATPVSGSTETTLVLLTVGMLFISLGIAIPVIYRKPYG